MIDLKPMKQDALKFGEPLKSVIEMQKNTMSEGEFVDFFFGLRKKAREIDAQSRGVQK
jgi:hypothetical protein